MRFLVDTNVVSEVGRPQGNIIVKRRLADFDPDDLFLSVITIGEVYKGITRLAAGKQRKDLEAWLAQTETYFTDRILSIDRDVAQLWGELTTRAFSAGKTLNAADGLIAATALHHGLRLMTRNVKDFEPTGVLIVNPWES